MFQINMHFRFAQLICNDSLN